MHEFIIEAIARGGYLGILLLMAIENVFPPIPSEVIMGLGGVLVARGTMEFWPLLAAGTAHEVAHPLPRLPYVRLVQRVCADARDPQELGELVKPRLVHERGVYAGC